MLDGLAEVITKLVDVDARDLGDSETVIALHRQLARLEAVVTRATADWDARQEWTADGGKSGATWLIHRCHVAEATARRRIRLGRELRHLPATEAAWLAGDLEEAHVSTLTSHRTPATAEAMTRDETLLVDLATRLGSRAFNNALTYWHQLADPEGVEADASRLHDGRRLMLAQTFQGAWSGEIVLDPVSGSVVSNALCRIEESLFQSDWKSARERLGKEPSLTDLGRTSAQRRADALVEMATRAMSASPDARRPEPLFTVVVDLPTMVGRVCELADQTPITPGALVQWLTRAWIERVVFDGPSRVIDVGVQRRLFTGATRRAVEVRDRECYHELCDEPAERCEVDHIDPHGLGGTTEQDNGRLACGFHNRLRNRPAQGP
jgi:hypothetical protein